jgi:hypothetical protein
MILHPAAWAVLVIIAIIVVWFTIRDDPPSDDEGRGPGSGDGGGGL